MQFERILIARSQRFLTDVHTHKLTATIPVYRRKLTKSGSGRRNFFLECNYGRTRCQRQECQLQFGDAPVILANGQKFTMSEIHNVRVCYPHDWNTLRLYKLIMASLKL